MYYEVEMIFSSKDQININLDQRWYDFREVIWASLSFFGLSLSTKSLQFDCTH